MRLVPRRASRSQFWVSPLGSQAALLGAFNRRMQALPGLHQSLPHQPSERKLKEQQPSGACILRHALPPVRSFWSRLRYQVTAPQDHSGSEHSALRLPWAVLPSGCCAGTAGASGGIGQPLSLLLKMNSYVDALSLYDVVGTPGVGADVGHVDSPAKARPRTAMRQRLSSRRP